LLIKELIIRLYFILGNSEIWLKVGEKKRLKITSWISASMSSTELTSILPLNINESRLHYALGRHTIISL